MLEKPPCVLFPSESPAWIVMAVVFGVSWIILGADLLRRWWRGQPLRIFENWPTGSEGRVISTRLIYSFAAASQLTPAGIVRRFLSANQRPFFDDIYAMGWAVSIMLTLEHPSIIFAISPLFIWWNLEFLAKFIYDFLFLAGLPQEIERTQQRYSIYRLLFDTSIAYGTAALMAAALYLVNSSYLGGVVATQEAVTIGDAVYFSVITITTIGYGDIYPLDCLRSVARWEALMGVILIVIVLGTAIGIAVSEITGHRREES